MYAAAISDLRISIEAATQSLVCIERGMPGDPDELLTAIAERRAALALLERSEPKKEG